MTQMEEELFEVEEHLRKYDSAFDQPPTRDDIDRQFQLTIGSVFPFLFLVLQSCMCVLNTLLATRLPVRHGIFVTCDNRTTPSPIAA